MRCCCPGRSHALALDRRHHPPRHLREQRTAHQGWARCGCCARLWHRPRRRLTALRRHCRCGHRAHCRCGHRAHCLHDTSALSLDRQPHAHASTRYHTCGPRLEQNQQLRVEHAAVRHEHALQHEQLRSGVQRTVRQLARGQWPPAPVRYLRRCHCQSSPRTMVCQPDHRLLAWSCPAGARVAAWTETRGQPAPAGRWPRP